MRLNVGLCVLLFLAAGCATVPYPYGKDGEYVHGPRLAAGEPQIAIGRPNRFLDACDWIWPESLLGKLMLWNAKVDSHQISPETIEAIRRYLADNDLRDVKVRINGYSVGDEWRRTIHNTAIGGGWRYTLGVAGWFMYTILPGRFFGGDNYNPYSNTINLYSDLVPVALHESGHAKDFARRRLKGTYAAAYSHVPFFNLYPEGKATADALGYLNDRKDRARQKAAYKLLYPAYGSYIGGDAADWLLFPVNYAVKASAIVSGHVVGRIRAAFVPRMAPEPVEPAASK
jgi:hypothetical protein